MSKSILRVFTLTLTLLSPLFASGQSVQEKISAAMKMDYRTEAEIKRDANRTPLEALTFMGLKDDMTVIEFFPAGGWYTKILAPVLADKGKLYVVDSPATFERWGDLNDNAAIKKASKIPLEASYNGAERRYNIGELNFPRNEADLFLNIREYHNLSAEDKTRFNKAVYAALKPGGKYVIIDHSRRPMRAEDDGPLFRREDPVKVILEVQAAGFMLEKSSDMFYKPNDNLDLEVGHESVTGQTDRFFFVFKKP